MTDTTVRVDPLPTLAREWSALGFDNDRKQLRFNEIVETAKTFYNDPAEGVKEMIEACDKNSPLYVKGRPMWQVLREEYGWMLDHDD
ncbi:hypothetical protein GCM10011360_17990 [Primorskyibacter flagellatus]|uniref:Uncharacterized protein n=1 Tax=Primorskyibacter flagellatus TaxID=1387277 RepID=A0A917A652_9RHOB|nr:hypothetical protein [Primorskyibacter flagellatus]GGE30373.1 hypothetical protein GCM10011360_17990 [Primorskyibacter flagellatus]